MEIYKAELFEIFRNNFDYPIVTTELGKAIKMPPRDAFIYSSVTGAGYLDNPLYPFTPKGLLKLFYNAFDYKFVTGIFDNLDLKNTPYIIGKAKPEIFNGDKFIVPFEFESDKELTDRLGRLYEEVQNPMDFLVQRVEISKKGNGMEPLFEYLASEYFKRCGYIVETQIPLAHSLGSPDFGGYYLEKIISALSDNFTSGFNVIELAMIRMFPETIADDSKKDIGGDLLVGDAKTSTKQMTKQLIKYLSTGLFDEGYEIVPKKTSPSKEYFGLITLDDNYELVVKKPKDKYEADNPLSKKEYLEWLLNYLKMYIIANLDNDEFNTFYLSKVGKPISSQKDIVDFIEKLEVEEIVRRIGLVI